MEDDLITSAWEIYHANYPVVDYLFQRINQDRAAAGHSQLELREDMSIAATYRCLHMHKHNYAAHFLNGVDLANEAYMGFTDVYVDTSENICEWPVVEQGSIGNAYKIADRFHNDLNHSYWHQYNILRPEYTRTGVGFVIMNDGKYANLVQFFTDRTDF